MGEATGVRSHRELVADEGGAAKKHPEQYISRGNMYHKQYVSQAICITTNMYHKQYVSQAICITSNMFPEQYVSRGNKKLKVPKSNTRSR